MIPPRSTPWTPDEDKLLIEAVAACGAKICWKHVAKSMSGRDNKACRKRWIHSLDPKLRKGRWTINEDTALLMAVNKHGKRWYEVAKDLPGRTDDQCAKRYKEAVDPSIRRDPWTREEDDKLWEAFQRLGNKWHAISCTLNGRPAVHCRNRLQSLQRLRAVTNDMEQEAVPQISGSPANQSFLNFPTPSETTSLSPALTFEECVQSPSASSLSSWHPSTPPAEPSCSSRLTVVEMPPSVTHSPVSAGEIRCSASMDGAHHHAHQHFPFPEASCVSGAFASDPRAFGIAVNPTQADFWSELPSQQAWASNAPIHFVRNATSPSIRGGSDQAPSNVDGHGNNLHSCPRISDALDVTTVPDAMTGATFIMTCPIPHCCFQCQEVLDMWRHVTWTHVRPDSNESGIESIVERVVLGGLS